MPSSVYARSSHPYCGFRRHRWRRRCGSPISPNSTPCRWPRSPRGSTKSSRSAGRPTTSRRYRRSRSWQPWSIGPRRGHAERGRVGLFDRFKKAKPKPRVAVIGLDGVGAPLIEALTDRGVMPRMAALRRAGTVARMTSSIPTISSVSWSGFMTGTNPGRHGIYGFTDVKRDSYAVYFPNYRHVQAPTIWDVLGAEGRRSIVLNIPNTYPAKDINGVLVSGFVAVNIERAVTPASVLPLLKSQGYKIDVDYVNANERVDAFFLALTETLAARRRTC